MRAKKIIPIIIVVLLVALSACAPKVVPTQAPSTAPPASVPGGTAQTAPQPSAQDAAWDKVVAAAKKEGTVTVYGSAFVADVSRRMTRDFEKQYGIRLEILAGSGNQLLEKVRVEQKIGKPIGDIMGSSGGSITQFVTDGLSIDATKELPELRDKNIFTADPVYSPGGEIIFFAWDVTPPIINTNLIKPQDEPKSWLELLEPKWKGKILSPDPRSTGSTAFYYSLRYFKVIDLDYLQRLSKQEMGMWQGNNREGIKMVARGEYWMYLFGPMDGIAPVMAEGAPIKGIAMKEGVPMSGRGIAMVKNSAHPNAAKLFLNWMLTKEGQTAFFEEAKMQPLRKDVTDFTYKPSQLVNAKLLPRTWDSEEWSQKEMKTDTMKQIFGDK